VIVGTNGKTTTSLMVAQILTQARKRVLRNTSGANLLNGIASLFVLNLTLRGKLGYDYIVCEVDENTLVPLSAQWKPDGLIVLNLFRDQLDRYGELETIAARWSECIHAYTRNTTVILNADDPLVSSLADATQASTYYFGFPAKTMRHQHPSSFADSIYCPFCHTRLSFVKVSFGHLGEWRCGGCKRKRADEAHFLARAHTAFPLQGEYNRYNTLAAATYAKALGIYDNIVTEGLKKITPAFGRQEKISYKGKQIQLFLSKNPTSATQSMETIIEMGGKHVMFVLNDRIPDGTDVSWIWDIDLESYVHAFASITVAGDRAYDMALRFSYAVKTGMTRAGIMYTEPSLRKAIEKSMENLPSGETLYILPTYSAMLEVRKILTGRSIL
jgi:UDP-N-acetylmuramyl tripeptide synthase